jgi:hypothetical protein
MMELDNNTPPYRHWHTVRASHTRPHGRVPGRIEPIEPNPTVKCQYCQRPDGYAYDTLHASIAVERRGARRGCEDEVLALVCPARRHARFGVIAPGALGRRRGRRFRQPSCRARKPVHVISTLAM